VTDVAPIIGGFAGVKTRDGVRTGLTPQGEAEPVRIGHLLFGQEWDGLRSDSVKYLRAADGEERLYDLAEDPREIVNVVSSRPYEIAAARALLDGMTESGPSPRGASQ
jgi:hypothetical protein